MILRTIVIDDADTANRHLLHHGSSNFPTFNWEYVWNVFVITDGFQIVDEIVQAACKYYNVIELYWLLQKYW